MWHTVFLFLTDGAGKVGTLIVPLLGDGALGFRILDFEFGVRVQGVQSGEESAGLFLQKSR